MERSGEKEWDESSFCVCSRRESKIGSLSTHRFSLVPSLSRTDSTEDGSPGGMGQVGTSGPEVRPKPGVFRGVGWRAPSGTSETGVVETITE